MLLRAAEEWNIDLANSYMIGDSDRDIQAGTNAGVKESIRIETNAEGALLSAVNKILKSEH